MSETLKDLQLFATVVACNGFAKASEPLGLTPSAVSKAIARLELRLGAKLFTRSTRNIKLTEAGTEMYRRTQAILAAIEEAETVVANISAEPQGDLRILCSDAFATLVIVPLLEQFQNNFPRIRVHLHQGDGPIDLIQEDYDVAIRFERPVQKGLNIIKLKSDPWVICAAPAYLQRLGSPAKPQDLKHHRCLAIRARGRLDDTWQFRGGKRNIIQLNPVFSGIGMVVKSAALQGLGIARLANFLVEKELQNGELKPLLTDYAPADLRSIYAVTPDRGFMPVKTRVFIEMLQKSMLDVPTNTPPAKPTTPKPVR